MATAQDVIDRVRRLINDEASAFVSGLRWSDAEMLEWITDGEREIVQFKPEANAVTDWFAVTAEFPRQRLNPEVAYRLIRVEANGTGAPDLEPDDVPPVITGHVEGVGIEITWDAATFGDGQAVTNYEIYRTDAQTLDGQANFVDPPVVGEMTLLTTVGAVLTYDDTTATDYLNRQYAYLARAIGAEGGELDSNVYQTTQPS